MLEIDLPRPKESSEPILRRSRCPAIVYVTDFGDEWAKSHCELALVSVFHPHAVNPPQIVHNHHVPKFDIRQAAFHTDDLACRALRNTIFIGVVDPGVGTDRKGLVLETNQDHYFVGPDNGIFYPVASREGIKRIWEIDMGLFADSSVTFQGRDVFSPTAARIACGYKPASLGRSLDAMVELNFDPGEVVFEDDFGNVRVNASIPPDARSIRLAGWEGSIPVVHTFADVGEGQPLALKGSSGLLELAVNLGNGAEYFGYKPGDKVVYKFSP